MDDETRFALGLAAYRRILPHFMRPLYMCFVSFSVCLCLNLLSRNVFAYGGCMSKNAYHYVYLCVFKVSDQPPSVLFGHLTIINKSKVASYQL
jgi:hypothetical protein